MLSQKQLKAFSHSSERYHIWVGSVRSGKTYVSILRFLDFLKNSKGDVMLVGYTRDTLQRNVIVPLYEILGLPPPSGGVKHASIHGRTIYFVGAHQEGASARIQGATLSLAYVDEAAKIPHSVWVMLDTRLSKPDSKLLATCNPEHPTHWLKTHYIENPHLSKVVHTHVLDDNPVLTDEYKDAIKNSVSGVWYKRLILGEWALAEGAVFDFWQRSLHVCSELERASDYYICGIDYGTTNPFAAVIVGVSETHSPALCVERELYYDPSKTGYGKTDSQLAEILESLISLYNPSAIYLDPSAKSFELELRRRDIRPRKAKNDVLNGIRSMSNWLYNGELKIYKGCTKLIEEMEGYVWDDLKSGKEEPKKENDHSVDALRYALYTHFGTRKNLKQTSIKKTPSEMMPLTHLGWMPYR